jgi:hypothetical protein
MGCAPGLPILQPGPGPASMLSSSLRILVDIVLEVAANHKLLAPKAPGPGRMALMQLRFIFG